MNLDGGCYCGAVRYHVEGPAQFKAQCHCRECQYISGGGPNYFVMLAENGFRYTSGEPASFARTDLENTVTREFCATCGTHIVTRLATRPVVVVKVGTLDDPAKFGGPIMAIHTLDKQPFHVIPEGIPAVDRLP